MGMNKKKKAFVAAAVAVASVAALSGCAGAGGGMACHPAELRSAAGSQGGAADGGGAGELATDE